MTSLKFSRWRPLTSRINIRFQFGNTHVRRRSGSPSVLNFVKISLSTAELKLFPVWENERPPFWNSTSGFDFDVPVVIGASHFPSANQIFRVNRTVGGLAIILCQFSSWQTSAMLFPVHPRRAVDGVSLIIKFWTGMLHGFWDIAIFRLKQFSLTMPIHAPFGWVFGARFLKWCHSSS